MEVVVLLTEEGKRCYPNAERLQSGESVLRFPAGTVYETTNDWLKIHTANPHNIALPRQIVAGVVQSQIPTGASQFPGSFSSLFGQQAQQQQGQSSILAGTR